MKKFCLFALVILALAMIAGCAPSADQIAAAIAKTEAAKPQPTYTPYPTYTPIPTNTPLPTATPRPTATPKPSVEDVLLNNGLKYQGEQVADNRPVSVYGSDIVIMANGQLNPGMTAGLFKNGELRLVFMLTEVTAQQSVDLAIKIIQEIYGDTIANWMESHFVIATSTVNTGNEVVEGRWIAVGAQKIDNATIKIMLIVAPDANVPAGLNP